MIQKKKILVIGSPELVSCTRYQLHIWGYRTDDSLDFDLLLVMIPFRPDLVKNVIKEAYQADRPSLVVGSKEYEPGELAFYGATSFISGVTGEKLRAEVRRLTQRKRGPKKQKQQQAVMA